MHESPPQVTFRLCNPKTNTNVWKSVSVTNFKVQSDKRSCKSDQITVTMDPTNGNKYTIQAKYDEDVQISIEYERVADGFKIGDSPRGGFTYFGQLSSKPAPSGDAPDYAAGGDGYAIHRIWPRCNVSGIVRVGNDVQDLDGARGVFIHAIQGLRPNLLAANWNFANFQSVGKEGEEAVSLIMMEFTSTPQYGSKTVNIGSVVVGDRLVAVTAGGSGVVGGSNVTHVDPIKDAETDYDAPSALKFSWEATRLEDGKPAAAGNAKVHALLHMDLVEEKETYKTRGLVEKVDVLGQIPYLIRKFVNYAAGTKPYIYTVRIQADFLSCSLAALADSYGLSLVSPFASFSGSTRSRLPSPSATAPRPRRSTSTATSSASSPRSQSRAPLCLWRVPHSRFEVDSTFLAVSLSLPRPLFKPSFSFSRSTAPRVRGGRSGDACPHIDCNICARQVNISSATFFSLRRRPNSICTGSQFLFPSGSV